MYCHVDPKLFLFFWIHKVLASLGVDSLEARWSSDSKSISQVKDYSNRKYSRLLPLVTLALSRPEEDLQSLLFQLLRYSSCGICGNELEGLAIITWGQKSLFPLWPALHHFFCYHLYWCGDTQKEHLGFMFGPLWFTGLIVVRNVLRVVHRHSGDKCFP